MTVEPVRLPRDLRTELARIHQRMPAESAMAAYLERIGLVSRDLFAKRLGVTHDGYLVLHPPRRQLDV